MFHLLISIFWQILYIQVYVIYLPFWGVYVNLFLCYDSTASTGPISWLVDGPQTLHHDFSASFCEINLKMHLYNSSGATAFVRIDTLDFAGSGGHLNSVNVVQSATPDNQAGWYDVTPVNELKVTSNVLETQPGKALSLESVSPYIWSGSSSTNLHLEPMSSAEIPLQICVFSPGTYDLSNYVLNWNLPSQGQGDSDETRQQSGKCQGYKYYLTVLQSTWEIGKCFAVHLHTC